jgi:hypothetical protein
LKFESQSFREIWAVDYEFHGNPGDHPTIVCLVAHELLTGRTLRIWQDELSEMQSPPYTIGPNSLFIAYYSSAELSCHLALGWPLPTHILDLFTEFRNLTNGLPLPCGKGLIGALAYFGIDSIGALQKETMRDLILSGGPWSNDDREAILDYCHSDVKALVLLLGKMAPELELERALLRGQFMAAAAKIEYQGIPIDMELFNQLQENWGPIKTQLVQDVDANYGVFEDGHFRLSLFERYLIANNIPWPILASGTLKTDDDTFKDMAKIYPQLKQLRDLRSILSQLKLSSLSIGKDGRNRCLLSAFQARTGRNQPSNSRFIFGTSAWFRSLIKPKSGMGLAYIDWSQQEFGIAAKLSEDFQMQKAYRSGDPYLAFGKQAGAVPTYATKESHREDRDRFKACVLGVNYGMGEKALADRIQQSVLEARDLLKKHQGTFKQFWRWSNGALDYAMFYGKLWTVFGWTINVTENPNPRMLRNFLIQANGAEMLRLACILVLNEGVNICAPVHDAILIEAPIDELDDKIHIAQNVMKQASKIVLSGFGLNTDVEKIKYPDRFSDRRGEETWNTILDILAKNL